MIKFRCLKCNKKIGVPEKYEGKRVKCPKCKSAVTVPKPVFEEMSLSQSNDIEEEADQDNKSFEEDGLLDELLKDEPVESIETKLEPNLHPNIELTKDCPYCGEEILEIAQKCKHCKEHLLSNNQDNNLQQKNINIPNFQYKINIIKNYLGGIIIIFAIGFCGMRYLLGGFTPVKTPEYSGIHLEVIDYNVTTINNTYVYIYGKITNLAPYTLSKIKGTVYMYKVFGEKIIYSHDLQIPDSLRIDPGETEIFTASIPFNDLPHSFQGFKVKIGFFHHDLDGRYHLSHIMGEKLTDFFGIEYWKE